MGSRAVRQAQPESAACGRGRLAARPAGDGPHAARPRTPGHPRVLPHPGDGGSRRRARPVRPSFPGLCVGTAGLPDQGAAAVAIIRSAAAARRAPGPAAARATIPMRRHDAARRPADGRGPARSRRPAGSAASRAGVAGRIIRTATRSGRFPRRRPAPAPPRDPRREPPHGPRPTRGGRGRGGTGSRGGTRRRAEACRTG
jgi:hypothetical protein